MNEAMLILTNVAEDLLVETATEAYGDIAGRKVRARILFLRNMITSIGNYALQERRRNADNKDPYFTDFYEQDIENDKLELADHLFRNGDGEMGLYYTHHAIYIGDGKVIHYADADNGIYVHVSSLQEFANGYPVKRFTEQRSPLLFTREEAVRRAKSRLGENRYHLAINNCENFVRWCRAGGEHF